MSISTSDWCTLIRCLDALQVGEFTAMLVPTENNMATVYPQKHLPHLRELHLQLHSVDGIFNPLPSLVLPSLSTLCYNVGTPMKPDFWLTLFLSSPHITTLHLGCPYQENTSLVTKEGIWSYASQLEVLIIDVFDYYYLGTEFWWLEKLGLGRPPLNLRRLVLVYITDEPSSIGRWLLQINAWSLLWAMSWTGISIEVRQETNANYSRLTPSELRKWIEMWYVVVRYAVISFNTKPPW